MRAKREVRGGLFAGALLVLLLVVMSPPGWACDLIEEPPDPALFMLHDLEGDPLVYMVVEERSLGAGHVRAIEPVRARRGDLRLG